MLSFIMLFCFKVTIMLFAQFYQLSTGYIPGTIPPKFGEKRIIEACGDRAVIILDGRFNLRTNDDIARLECIKRKFIGYSLHKGTFSNNTIIQSFKQV